MTYPSFLRIRFDDAIQRPWQFLGALYAVGVVGMCVPLLRPYFLLFTPFLLLLNCVLLLITHQGWNARTVLYFGLVVLLGYSIELAGVRTGLIFGEYNYTDVLGLGLAGVPFIIGINWLVVLYGSAAISFRWLGDKVYTPVMAAALMTVLDVFLEPVAIKLGFWVWSGGVPPLRNYVGWFLTSLTMQYVGYWLGYRPYSRVAIPLYVVQVLFFALLILLL
jgi:uncharacterized membrane protein